jgi:hypothetical protein
VARSLSVALAQYKPINDPNPVTQLHGHATEILSGTRDLDWIVFPQITAEPRVIRSMSGRRCGNTRQENHDDD